MIESAAKGCGLYSMSEVAQYLHIHPSTLRSWFDPVEGRKALLKGEVVKTDDEGAWLNFHDFLQAYAVKLLKDGGAKPKDVREAIAEARDKYKLPYPLSMRGFDIYTDVNGRVHIKRPGDTEPTELTGPRKGQGNFHEVIKNYINRLEFDEAGLAARFVVYEKKYHGRRHRVVMDPQLNFGEPSVDGTPYRAATLRDAVRAEGSTEAVMRLYDVKKGHVKIAIEAFQHSPELR